ncbi:serine/threonine protein kinase [Microcystis elabens FACHB-917]|nr:serine/threonine protein kinase [Microcystis elabens FACHB-917]
MTAHTIRLPNGHWQYDESKPLGRAGGFGEVFRGKGPDGDVAVKRLKISADVAAHRELVIGKQLMNGNYENIVPVFDAGQDSESDRYFLVMTVCDYSLQDKINEACGAVEVSFAQEVIRQIIEGLKEVSTITHRDLKPDNILHHEGRWKIADFGIAKFVEDSTSLQTLRNSLTPTYAAPEQWKGERPSSATDIYALGCIIYALFTGSPPFTGSLDDIREGHLHGVPEPLRDLPPRFSAFVSHMLRKPPNARPTLERCFNVLSEIDLASDSSLTSSSVIDLAAEHVAKREAEEEAMVLAASTLRKERQDLYNEAKLTLEELNRSLFLRLREASESVKILSNSRLAFGEATLDFFGSPESLVDSHYINQPLYPRTGWDVLGWSIIRVQSRRSSYAWSASLLYVDKHDGNGYRWYEVAFWTFAQHQSPNEEPYALEGYSQDIDLACSHGMHSKAVAYGPLPIDSEDEESFHRRWSHLVAKAATGDLMRPGSMPVRDLPG